jgi:hypothetical protein
VCFKLLAVRKVITSMIVLYLLSIARLGVSEEERSLLMLYAEDLSGG